MGARQISPRGVRRRARKAFMRPESRGAISAQQSGAVQRDHTLRSRAKEVMGDVFRPGTWGLELHEFASAVAVTENAGRGVSTGSNSRYWCLLLLPFLPAWEGPSKLVVVAGRNE